MAAQGTSTSANETQMEQPQQVVRKAPEQACKTVLATPELLESILTNLSPKSTFGIIRVSTAFKVCVAKSPAIQEKLFFRPPEPPNEIWYVSGYEYCGTSGIQKRCYARWNDGSAHRTVFSPPLTPVVLNPCISMIGTNSNAGVKLDLPMAVTRHPSERTKWRRVTDLLHSDSLGNHTSFMDTHFSKPLCEKLDVFLHVMLMDRAGNLRVEFSVRQVLQGQDASTPRSMLKAFMQSSHVFRLWRRGRMQDGSEWACHWMHDVKISELIKNLEESEKLTAIVGDETVFLLCNAMVPTDAERAAVELDSK